MKKILVIGGTGAMGRYTVPELLRLGFDVDVAALNRSDITHENLTSIIADAMDNAWLKKQVTQTKYDVILDFMNYSLPDFRARMQLMLDSTDQYMFLSSCRVYADKEIPVKETSPRLLDVEFDADYRRLYETEYSLYKAMEEDMLRDSGKKNWTVILPATTYSTGRAQLVTLEANSFVYRAWQGKKVILPAAAKDCPATLSWGGDVGVMIARLAGNAEALGQKFITATAEHHTWKEIAEIYHELIDLKYEWVDTETYLRAIASESRYPYAKYQLIFARLFHRITDNSKILRAADMKQEDLMPFYNGMKTELAKISLSDIKPDAYINEKMDAYFANNKL